MWHSLDLSLPFFGIANGQISIIFDSYLPTKCPYLLFLDDNLSKYLWICTKLCMCIDNVELWFGIPNWKILSVFERNQPATPHFQTDTSKYLWMFTKTGMCINIVNICKRTLLFLLFLLSPTFLCSYSSLLYASSTGLNKSKYILTVTVKNCRYNW